MERVDSDRGNLTKPQLRRHKAQQLRDRMRDARLQASVDDQRVQVVRRDARVTERIEELQVREDFVSERENALVAREADIRERETTIGGREQGVIDAEAALPELRRKARREGYEDGVASGRADAEKITAEAHAQAQAVLDRARRVAEDHIHDAEASARETTKKAEALAGQIIGSANATAEKLQEDAHKDRQAAERDRHFVQKERSQAYDDAFQTATIVISDELVDFVVAGSGARRVDVEVIAELNRRDPEAVAQAREAVRRRLEKQARSRLKIGTPVEPSEAAIAAEAAKTGERPVTDAAQAHKLVSGTAGGGGGTGSGLGANKTQEPRDFGR